MRARDAESVDGVRALLVGGERFDVALVDTDAAGSRWTELIACGLPIVAVSRLRRVPEGAVAQVPKPIRTRQLSARLPDALGLDRTIAVRAERFASGPSLYVLVADDNAVNRKVAVRILERLGHRVDVVASGREAIDAAIQQPTNSRRDGRGDG
jgi:hypothetical protein